MQLQRERTSGNEQHRRKKFLVIEVREEPQEMSCRESFLVLCTVKIPYLLRDFEAFLLQKIKGLFSTFLQQNVCVQSGIFANDLREKYVNEL